MVPCWVCHDFHLSSWEKNEVSQKQPLPQHTSQAKQEQRPRPTLLDSESSDEEEFHSQIGKILSQRSSKQVKHVEKTIQQKYKDVTNQIASLQQRYNDVKTESMRRFMAERQLRRKFRKDESENEEKVEHCTLYVVYASLNNVVLVTLKLKEEEEKRIVATSTLHHVEEEYARNDLKLKQLEVQQNEKWELKYAELMSGGCTSMSLSKLLLVQNELQNAVANNNALIKSAACLQEDECIICKDSKATVAIIPCGHLCFCQADSLYYKPSTTSQHKKLCPICQQVIYYISHLMYI